MTEDNPAQASVEPAPEKRAGCLHWWQRVLPLSGIAVVLLSLAAFAFPGLDNEIEMSTTRSPQPFVELYLTNRPAAICTGGSPKVRFRVESHLQRVRTLGFRIRVVPGSPRAQIFRERGKTRVAPGQAKSVRRDVTAPHGTAYDIIVRLRHRPEHLRIHCDRTAR